MRKSKNLWSFDPHHPIKPKRHSSPNRLLFDEMLTDKEPWFPHTIDARQTAVHSQNTPP
jgi:hypothetical protein